MRARIEEDWTQPSKFLSSEDGTRERESEEKALLGFNVPIRECWWREIGKSDWRRQTEET
eukprot:2951957-Pleurochrysis_carterae.AAC.1